MTKKALIVVDVQNDFALVVRSRFLTETKLLSRLIRC